VVIADIKTDRGEYELKINGITYSLLAPGELTLRDHYIIGAASVRLQYLHKEINVELPADATDAQRKEFDERVSCALAELNQCLKTCTASILSRVPVPVQDKIAQVQLMSILTAYRLAMQQESSSRDGKIGKGVDERPFVNSGSLQ
jgi:hypothetical protein